MAGLVAGDGARVEEVGRSCGIHPQRDALLEREVLFMPAVTRVFDCTSTIQCIENSSGQVFLSKVVLLTSFLDKYLNIVFGNCREAEMRDLNELTNSRVAWFGIMSLLVCLGVAGWQLWHLKTFFERKKLL